MKMQLAAFIGLVGFFTTTPVWISNPTNTKKVTVTIDGAKNELDVDAVIAGPIITPHPATRLAVEDAFVSTMNQVSSISTGTTGDKLIYGCPTAKVCRAWVYVNVRVFTANAVLRIKLVGGSTLVASAGSTTAVNTNVFTNGTNGPFTLAATQSVVVDVLTAGAGNVDIDILSEERWAE